MSERSERETAIDAQAEAILATLDQEPAAELDDLEDEGPLEALFDWLERQQRLLFYPLFAGVAIWPLAGPEIGLSVTGSAVVGAGLVPLLTGRYRTRFMRLYGLPARLRGLFSIAMGAFVIYTGFALP